ncbi:hypothetical protein HK097_003496, partial [Rhizophlyctis rosea]
MGLAFSCIDLEALINSAQISYTSTSLSRHVLQLLLATLQVKSFSTTSAKRPTASLWRLLFIHATSHSPQLRSLAITLIKYAVAGSRLGEGVGVGVSAKGSGKYEKDMEAAEEMVMNWGGDGVSVVRTSALSILLETHQNVHPLSPSLYARTIGLMKDDDENVRLAAMMLAWAIVTTSPNARLDPSASDPVATKGGENGNGNGNTQQTGLRMLDDCFMKLCDMVGDGSMAVRRQAMTLLSNFRSVNTTLLLQTLSKELLRKRERERQKEAGNEFSWNSLFMNSDAVAEAMAKKLGVKKADILDPESENMAVRLALAETHIINETKQYLEAEGIDLSAFTTRKTRSDTIILVKNLPARKNDEDLAAVFAKFGDLGRVVLPPAKTIALVEYLHHNEAKTAFRKLAFTKFGHLPLFLEWAPVGTFKKGYSKEEEEERKKRKQQVEEKGGDVVMEDAGVEGEKETKPTDSLVPAAPEEDTDMMPVATLFVKNLNFDTKEDALKRAFEGVGGLRSVRVATKPDRKTGGTLSMGFGFLEFERKEDAVRCMKALQGTKLDGHVLQLKFSNA